MKIKKLTILSILTLLIFSCNNATLENSELSKNTEINANWIEIGILQNGKPTITGNKNALIKSWEKNLMKYSRIKAKFTDVYIIKSEDEYQLIFKGNEFTSSFFVKSTETNSLIAAVNTSCTTPDCPQEPEGCIVTYKLSKPDAPGACTPCNNGGTCTKTTSNFAMISFE